MPNKKLVKTKTEKARINGLPPYLKDFRGHPLPMLFITQAALLATGQKPTQTDSLSLKEMQETEGKQRHGF